MEKELKEFGLKDNEVKIYLALLKEKLATASKLAKSARINRTTAYLELENLIKMGLASYIIKDSKRYYQAASPDKLVEVLNAKKEKIKSIIPELKCLHKDTESFKMEIFEGKEGIKTFYQDILNTKPKEILAFGVTGKAMEVLEFHYPHIVKNATRLNIKERALANISSKKIMEKHPKSSLKVRYLPKKYEAKVTTIIYGDKVSIQSLQKDKIYVTIIKDKNLADSYKNYFEFMWERAER